MLIRPDSNHHCNNPYPLWSLSHMKVPDTNSMMYTPQDKRRLNLSLTVIISLCLHFVFWAAVILPDLDGLLRLEEYLEKMKFQSRDVIVNINQDEQRHITPKTLLSDKDSTAQGYITTKKGDRWLNNSLDFRVISGTQSGRKGRAQFKGKNNETILLHDDSEIVIQLTKPSTSEKPGMEGDYIKIKIPDKNDITRENSIFYSNKGMFSFNTAKFRNFQYFKDMKDKIAGNWYPPIMANAIMGGSNPITGTYAPGRTRIMAIPSQEVKLFFTMNRNGDVLDVEIVESYGNKSLDSSCLDAIRLSKSFGAVPEDIRGNVVVIPFIFGYYAY